MKLIKTLLKIILVILFLIITISFSIKEIVINTTSKEIVSKKISGYILDDIIDEYEISKLETIEKNIRNNRYINKITRKYIDSYLNGIIYDKVEKINIEDEVNSLIENELSTLSDNQKNIIKENVKNKSEKLEKRLDNYISSEFETYKFKDIIKGYNLITNKSFRIILIILSIVNIIILMILEKRNFFKSFQTVIYTTCTLTIIFTILVKLLFNFINQNFIGGFINDIDINILIKLIFVEILISLVIYIINKFIIKKDKVKK